MNGRCGATHATGAYKTRILDGQSCDIEIGVKES
jgi:hypothetical protein